MTKTETMIYQNTIKKTNDRGTRTPLNIGDKIRCCGRISVWRQNTQFRITGTIRIQETYVLQMQIVQCKTDARHTVTMYLCHQCDNNTVMIVLVNTSKRMHKLLTLVIKWSGNNSKIQWNIVESGVKYHIPKSIRIIVHREQIDTYNIYIHNRLLFWLGAGT
jgi:2-hydroxy-3-keto-5-methylthiopentenyl-1-phosphate phosphatase